MSKATKNVFEQLQESLATIVEELSEANNALYVVATTVMDLSDKLDSLSAKLDAITGAATKVVKPITEKPAVAKPAASTFKFAELKKEMK